MVKILCIDDDPSTRRQLAGALEDSGYAVEVAASGEAGLAQLRALAPDVIITDLKMGGLGGLDVVEHTRRERPDTPVIILTGHGNIETAVDAMRRGALDFLTKPVDLDRLELVIEKALRSRALLQENSTLRRQLSERRAAKRSLLGHSSAMQTLLAAIERVADTSATVLILGESGSGKELVAETIHRLSGRAGGPLVKVNCAALPETLLEAELFGHERGAFTGAHRSRTGRFEAADGGTMFLDEIGDLNLAAQLKLFRVLQERVIERIGASRPIPVDVRLVTATNRDLAAEVRAGRFREELYYRLRVVELATPPLRARAEDVPLLAEAFCRELAAEHGRSVEGFSRTALNALVRHPWPGNVRELRNVVESAVVMARGREIELADLPAELRGSEGAVAALTVPYGEALADAERRYILATLDQVGGNKTQAARQLGVGAKTLYRKLESYGRHER